MSKCIYGDKTLLKLAVKAICWQNIGLCFIMGSVQYYSHSCWWPWSSVNSCNYVLWSPYHASNSNLKRGKVATAHNYKILGCGWPVIAFFQCFNSKEGHPESRINDVEERNNKISTSNFWLEKWYCITGSRFYNRTVKTPVCKCVARLL